MSINLPIHPTHPAPLFPPLVHTLVIYIFVSLSALQTGFICTIFLDATYMHYYMILVFLFLPYFSLYDSLWVHPCLCKWHCLFLWLSNIPWYVCPNLLSHSSADGHLGYFHVWLLQIVLQWTLEFMHPFKSWFSPDICPGMGLLGHKVALVLVF